MIQEMSPYTYSTSNTEQQILEKQVLWNVRQSEQFIQAAHPMQQQMMTTTQKYSFYINVSYYHKQRYLITK
jgi:hypothetical protein